MKTLLTIDTSSPNCAVALQHSGVLLERVSAAERQSAQRILPMISELLAESGIAIADLDLIAVVAGPGSFTGVRIGVAVAQGLSLTASIPVVPLSSLALTAMAGLEGNECEGVLVSEAAREGEVYFAAYLRSQVLGVERVGNEQVAPIAELDTLPEGLVSRSWCLAGSAWQEKAAILDRLGCSTDSQPTMPTVTNSVIAALGLLRFDSGEAVDAAQLRPNYVKEQLDYS